MLKIYNNLSRQKEEFQPIDPGKVRMYVCGITVYDKSHVGHARTFVAFDAMVRFMRFAGYQVHYVRNITDIDDKIIKRAQENNEPFHALTERFIEIMHQDFARLNLLPPDEEPRATDSINEMQDIIQSLLDKDMAYVGDEGDVYYRVERFGDYGKLSRKNLDELRAGERVDVDSAKENPLDFVLWKSAKPGEPKWPSPWGEGRPGWHIECSAMSKRCLGAHFDIHGGGSDLQFPHHENEIAQSEAANGCQYANYWIHSGMVQVDKEKMSKSLNNFFTIEDVIAEYRAESVRLFLLSGHYRSQLNYSQDNLNAADASLERLYQSLRDVTGLPEEIEPSMCETKYVEQFTRAMEDDFNTPEALAVLFEIAKQLNRAQTSGQSQQSVMQLACTLKYLGGVLGLLEQKPTEFLQSQASEGTLDASYIETQIAARAEAKANKNYALADQIRAELAAQGVQLDDGPSGTQWRFDN